MFTRKVDSRRYLAGSGGRALAELELSGAVYIVETFSQMSEYQFLIV